MNRLFIAALLNLFLFGMTAFSWPKAAGPVGDATLYNPFGQPPFDTGQIAPLYSGCGGQIAPVVNDAYEQQVVELVNEARASANLPPLKRSVPVTEAARYHATDMAQDDYFDHGTFDLANQILVFVCQSWERTSAYFSGFTGENIAAGQTTPEWVMQSWMASPGHKGNILNPASWEIGVGYTTGAGKYLVYWAQDFAKRSGVYPIVINREEAATDFREVNLYIYGNWQEMRFRNNNGSWTNWEPFQANPSWTLDPGEGDHTVSVELTDGAQTIASSDSIYLTSAASAPGLGNLPENVVFIYSIADQSLYPPHVDLTPLNTGTGDDFDWQVTEEGAFFSIDSLAGTTPESFRVTPDDFTTGAPATYEGEITVTVTNPAGVEGSPHTTGVTLNVVSGPLYKVFAPTIER